jgi:hypothetical protein
VPRIKNPKEFIQMKALPALSSILALTVSLAIHSAQAEPALGGAFNVTFYVEPTLAANAVYCYQFTTSGGVLGYPVSGTWSVPSFSEWSGDWYQVGDEIIMDSVFDGTDVLTYKGRLLNSTRIEGRFTQFDISGSTGSTQAGGTFLGVKIGGSCPSTGGAVENGNPIK